MLDNIHEENSAAPQRSLVAAIVAQVVHDAFFAEQTLAGAAAQSPAINWLTSRSGDAAYWRNHYCSLIDMNGDVVRQWAIDVLEGRIEPQNPLLATQGRDRRVSGVGIKTARAEWLKRNAVPPGNRSVPKNKILIVDGVYRCDALPKVEKLGDAMIPSRNQFPRALMTALMRGARSDEFDFESPKVRSVLRYFKSRHEAELVCRDTLAYLAPMQSVAETRGVPCDA